MGMELDAVPCVNRSGPVEGLHEMTRQSLILSLALASLAATAYGGPIVYVVGLDQGSGTQQFGAVDLTTGAFHQIGSALPEGSAGLIAGPNGKLLTLTFSGKLDSINPATGVATVIGPTGLGDCTVPTSGCGPNSANALTTFGASTYATDFAGNLYSVNQATGHAALIGLTGIPAVPFVPGVVNPDGSFNFFDETLFSAGGKLYATFDAATFNPATFVTTPVVLANLYRIDPLTAHATLVGPTDLGLTSIITVSGTIYAFSGASNQIFTLNLLNGHTTFVSDLDPAAGLVLGAIATPEPGSSLLVGLGIAAIAFVGRRRLPAIRLSLGCLLALGFSLCVPSSIFGQGPVFTKIDFPGATGGTQPWGINNRGDVVGQYVSDDKVTHGFLLSGGQYKTVDFPGATGTELYAINPQGDVGGVYTLAGARHGFLLSGGQFTKIDYPGAITTEVNTINPRGEIVGDFVSADNVTHGFLLSGGQYKAIDVPGSTLTLSWGINPQGDIMGSYRGGGVVHGFLLSDGDFTSFDFPGSTFTNATGFNARGDIAGQYRDSAAVNHAYFLSGDQFSTVDFPGATYTGATAMTPRGDVLGRYRNADGLFHGFLLVGFPPACIVSVPRIVSTPGGAAVTHSNDFTLVTAAKPAVPGEVLSLFATGLGPTRPSGNPGQPFPSNPPAAVSSLVEVRVAAKPAELFGAVGFPGSVDGYQVNFRVPADTVKGAVTIRVSSGLVVSTPVNIMVQ